MGKGSRLVAAALGCAVAAALGIVIFRELRPGAQGFVSETPGFQIKSRNEYLKRSNGWLEKGTRGPSYVLRAGIQDPPYLRTDSRGLRSAEPSKEKRLPRVLFTGDSMTFGFGVPEGSAYPSQLAQQLAGSAEVLNCAVIGYELRDSLSQIERLAPDLRPDLVVLSFLWNDLDDSRVFDSESAEPRTRAPRLEELRQGMFLGSSNMLRMAELSGLSGASFSDFLQKHQKGERGLPFRIGPAAAARFEQAATELTASRESVERAGGKLAILSLAPASDPIHDGLTRACSAAGVSLFALPPSLDLSQARWHLSWDPHPNGAAHAQLALRAKAVLAAFGLADGEAAKPLSRGPQVEASWREARDRFSLSVFKERIVLAPRAATENLHQVLGGFEDDNGTLGGGAVFLLQAPQAPKELLLDVALDRPSPGETLRTLEAHINGGPPLPVFVRKNRATIRWAIPARSPSDADTLPRGVVELTLHDPLLTSAAPGKRRDLLGVRVYSVRVETQPK